MEDSDLNNQILLLYEKVSTKLSEEQKKEIHFKSVSNFIYHLIERRTFNKKRNIKLQKLGEIRMKKRLLEYLKLLQDYQIINKKESFDYYEKYIDYIGTFMANYYNFSGSGGKIKILDIIIFFSIGSFLDIISHLLFKISFPVFIPSLLLISIIRIYLKHKQRKVYGAFY